ncbi:conserved hypothetical protein [Trichinella spiralis]|uniref:hypothetical protein n=1 Tax=Trichinella spiralis TaxID=6334 RepID=UPI0001EFBB74|nr:conserved hypothetical protein [Trichinella spiralis]
MHNLRKVGHRQMFDVLKLSWTTITNNCTSLIRANISPWARSPQIRRSQTEIYNLNKNTSLKVDGPDKDRWVLKLNYIKKQAQRKQLGAFAAYTTSQLNIFGHDGDTLGVNSAQLLLVKPKLPTIGIASQSCNLEQLHEPNVGRAAFGSTIQCFFGSVEFPEEPQSLDDSDAVSSHHQHWVRIFELP